MSSQFMTIGRCSGNMHVWHIHRTYPALPAMQILPGQEYETCTSTTRPLHRRLHIYVLYSPTLFCLSTIMDSFPPSKPRLEQHKPRYFENACLAAGRADGSWNRVNPLFLVLTPGVAELLPGTPFAYKYAARSTDCAFTSSHFAIRLGRAFLGRARALTKKTRPK
jgi:hypothetical protein